MRTGNPQRFFIGAAMAIGAIQACMAAPVATELENLSVEILADINRDGRVDARDRLSVSFAGGDQGALILPNIGDQENRCPGSDALSLSDAELEACHDAADDQARAPDYFAPIVLSPVAAVSAEAQGYVRATGPGAAKVRVFLRTDTGWRYLTPEDAITAETVKTGAELGVDARDIVRDRAEWDGHVTLEFSVTDGAREASDRVLLRVAPVIIHNHLERASTLFAPESDDDVHRAFMTGLTETVARISPDMPLERLNTVDNWAQDFVEFGHVSMPGPEGLKSIRIAVRSPQPTRSAGRALFDLKGPGFGVVQTGGDNYHQVDSFGNLETIPPYSHNGKSYPAGRVIYGDADDGVGPHADFARFFDAQAVQAPIVLDTSWLIIAHVDEFLQFLPADNERGWTIAVKDVPSALAILRQAAADGHGEVKAFSIEGGPQMTISELLSDAAFLEANERARRRIEMTLGRLMSETGVTEEELVRVPGLFEVADWDAFARRASVRAEELPPPPWLAEEGPGSEIIYYSPGDLLAFYPAPVNGVLLDRDTYILPKQWGPMIDGVDIMEAAIISVYADAGITASPVDAWYSHHVSSGEIHCGTNVTRAIDQPWWE